MEEPNIKKLDDYRLNDINNLNPMPLNTPSNFSQESPEEVLTNEQKDTIITTWENKPEVKKKEIGAYDKNRSGVYNKDREEPVKKNILVTYKTLAMIGILAIVVIALSIGYSVYKTGSLFPGVFINNSCEPAVVNINNTEFCESAAVYINNTCEQAVCGDCYCNLNSS
jgi:hypothetical protein